ncbi:hypothetical protein GWO43_19780 [candidate division KSB1 bacterium]|nr:hypothetical protein [candidate division KSB1 bacterium]NIR71409.1 hypothetical protein [candidate division KSB1 bacterium]NIS26311.1 hypothetical protein [candidate division KSB1 bacterium]NIT73074.1 hypothetical protein [candidate division KSB1 bacterium]NIU26981.1 hypothetical protein [candidate division KSB1 bacterium]
MPKTTLKDVTEKFGISLDDIVTYHKKGDKTVIESFFTKRKNRCKMELSYLRGSAVLE